MPATLTIRDQSLSPEGSDFVFELPIPSESITVRELIRERIYQEVDDYNRRVRAGDMPDQFHGLVRPGRIGRVMTEPGGRRAEEIDWRVQFNLAVEAYQRRQIIVLIGDRQTESLEETIEIVPETEVAFLRLVMLVGG